MHIVDIRRSILTLSPLCVVFDFAAHNSRCVSKYLEAQQRVGAVLQEANESQLAQQKQMMEMQKSFG